MNQIAILLATYNGIRYLPEMLNSIEAQSYQDFVCFIHDDGSEDGTADLLKQWVDAHPDKYQLLVGPSQRSAKMNFLWMLSQVDAEYYLFADQDDVWLPEKIAKSFERLQAIEADKRQPYCVFTDMYVVDSDLKLIDNSFIRYIDRSPDRVSLNHLLVDNPAAGCTFMFNHSLRNMALQLHDVNHIEMHDIWLLALAATYGREHVCAIEEPLVYYRQHDGNEMGAVAENIMQKIARNLRNIFDGEVFRRKHRFICRARELAEQLSMVDEVPPKQKEFLREFSKIGSKRKLKRIHFYKKHDISRLHGTKWMYIWV